MNEDSKIYIFSFLIILLVVGFVSFLASLTSKERQECYKANPNRAEICKLN